MDKYKDFYFNKYIDDAGCSVTDVRVSTRFAVIAMAIVFGIISFFIFV